MSKPRVLVGGSWDTGPGYPRAESMISALRSSGFEVAECRGDLPCLGGEKRRVIGRPWLWPQMVLRLARARSEFLRRLRAAVSNQAPDVILVPYPGHLAVRWVRSVFSGPVVLDLFLSAYDTVVLDRRRFRSGSLVARWLRRLDRRACEAASVALLDTPQHAEHVAQLVGLPSARFGWVPITDPAAKPMPAPYVAPGCGDRLEVLFFGTGVPLHGLPHLIEAVRLSRGVRLTLVGGSRRERELARQLGAERVRMLPAFVSREDLGREIDRCHLVAGIFDGGGKAGRVVPFKVVHGLAGGRPVLTADTPAIRTFLSPGVDCLVCPPADPVGLAGVFDDLSARPEGLAAIAAAGRATFEAHFSMASVGHRLAAVLAGIGVVARPMAGASPQPAGAAV